MTSNELTSFRLTTNKLFRRVSRQAWVAQRCDAFACVFLAPPGPGFNSALGTFSSAKQCFFFIEISVPTK